MLERVRIFANRAWHWDEQISLDIVRKRSGEDGALGIERLEIDGDGMAWKPASMFETSLAASLLLTPASAQELVNSLWECGIKPQQGAGSAGAMAAQERHLEDMRTLVFKPEATRNPGDNGRVA